jgi:hypothetical protein
MSLAIPKIEILTQYIISVAQVFVNTYPDNQSIDVMI